MTNKKSASRPIFFLQLKRTLMSIELIDQLIATIYSTESVVGSLALGLAGAG